MKLARSVGVVLVLLALGVAAFGGWTLSTAAPKSTVGFVDTQLIINSHPRVKELYAERDRLQKELDQEAANLSQEEQSALEAEYQAKLEEFEKEVVSDFTPKFLAEVDVALQKVAEEHGVDVVVNRNIVVYGGIDLTPAVLAELGLKQ